MPEPELSPAGLQEEVQELHSKYLYCKERVKEEKAALAQATQELDNAEKALSIVQLVAQQVQESAHQQISSVVSRCIQAVFPDRGYEFKIKFERKRGKTEARLMFVREGLELENPLGEAGGGVVEVTALALRLACLVLSRPKKQMLLVLDEPFKNVNGEEYQERVGELLLTLSKEFGVQMLIVSDDDWLKIGKVIEL